MIPRDVLRHPVTRQKTGITGDDDYIERIILHQVPGARFEICVDEKTGNLTHGAFRLRSSLPSLIPTRIHESICLYTAKKSIGVRGRQGDRCFLPATRSR